MPSGRVIYLEDYFAALDAAKREQLGARLAAVARSRTSRRVRLVCAWLVVAACVLVAGGVCGR